MAFSTSFDDGIICFTFDNNGYNSVTAEILEGLHEAVKRANGDDQVKGIVITGQGRIFSSGYELGTFIGFRNMEQCLAWSAAREPVMYDLFTCAKPVIAAINGHALGAGLIVAMAADYRIAVNHPRIKIGMPGVNNGIPLSNAEVEILKFGLTTDKNYRDLLFSRAYIDPETALRKDIVDELAVDAQEALEKAKAKVSSLMDAPGRAFIMLKQLEKRHAAEYIRRSSETFDWNAYASAFFNEAMQAEITRVKASMK